MKKILSITVKVLLCALFAFTAFWFILPPLNLQSSAFYGFVVFIILGCSAICYVSKFVSFLIFSAKKLYITDSHNPADAAKSLFGKIPLGLKLSLGSAALIILVMVLGSVIGAKLFNAPKYHDLLDITDGNFTEDVAEIGRDQIPVVDRDAASRLGLRKLGEISDLVSQFEITEDYTQINYGGRPVRVTSLKYGDFIKWFNNKDEGIPAYVLVDMTTQEAQLVRLENGIKYSHGEYFMRDLKRKLRFSYPTKIFDDISFEIDEQGVPYYVASTVKPKIGLFGGKDINGAVLLNAITGESKYYPLDEIPTWVDRVYNSDLIIEQLTYNGKYKSGFWNSIFGQKGVTGPTAGYNYLAVNDDVYLYTGITSVGKDESNIGFVLVNMRTKETKFYAIPGAEEYSAMSSAEGQVQHLNYTATFPLLLNVADRPSYFISLKDAAGLVKMYAFVDVQQYQIVGIGETIDIARNDYLNKLSSMGQLEEKPAQTETFTATVSELGSAVIGGNTTYFIRFSGVETIFTASVTDVPELVFVKQGDYLSVTHSPAVPGVIIEISPVAPGGEEAVTE